MDTHISLTLEPNLPVDLGLDLIYISQHPLRDPVIRRLRCAKRRAVFIDVVHVSNVGVEPREVEVDANIGTDVGCV